MKKIQNLQREIKFIDHNFNSFISDIKSESSNEIRFLERKIKDNFSKIKKYLNIIENLLDEQEKKEKKIAFKPKNY